MKIKRIVALLLLIITAMTCIVSCAEEPNDVTYREHGLEFTLPKSMRRSASDVYEFYLSSPDAVFMAKKLNAEFMESMAMPASTTAGEYADAYIDANYLDKTRISYSYDAERGAYSMRYNSSEAESTDGLLHSIVILGQPGAVWFVEICCDNDKSEIYEHTFSTWESTIRTYVEEKN